VTALSLLGWLAFRQGDRPRATVVLGEALGLGWEIGARDRLAEILESLAAVAAAEGRPHDAVRLGAAAAAQREELGLPLSLDQQASHEQLVQAARAALGEAAFAAGWAEGEAQPVGDVVAAVLDGRGWPTSHPGDDGAPP
jgi:hypothetical protein